MQVTALTNVHGSQEHRQRLEQKIIFLLGSYEPREFTFPKMNDVNEFGELMSKGTYASFSNIVYLGGACNVGKSTLASILIGADIPLTWDSTDSLEIFFGRFGIDLETNEMVPVSKGNREILTTVILGKPDMEASKSSESEINIQRFSMGIEGVAESLKDTQIAKSSEDSIVKPALGHPMFKTFPAKSYATIRDDIKEELKRGEYKVRIAPCDLVDFGGQKSYDMSHQLFIRQKGVFVLLIDGRKNLSDILKEYPQGDVTTASILLHWVNSILTYCGVEDDDILPLIIFAATHSDSFPGEEERKDRKLELIGEITALFHEHENHHRILYKSLYFINGRNENDVGIKNLKEKLVETAIQQKSWGQQMPLAWVPLQLQIAEMRTNGMNIISVEDISYLNKANKELALSEKQLGHFLKSQHSLGKIVYFDLPGLQSFLIIQPKALVDILRAVMTDRMFWPKDHALNKILSNVTNSGRITKQDLYQLWSQEKFNHCMPTEGIKEFIVKVLVNLDILVEPTRFIESKNVMVNHYLIPCIVNRAARKMTLDFSSMRGKTICLSHKLLRSDIPSAVSYKLIGALLNIWPIQETSEGVCLFHKGAVLSVDGTNDLSVFIKGNQILVYLTNAISSRMISRDIASVVQECVTVTLEKVFDFYQRSFGYISTVEPKIMFEIEIGEVCNTDECIIPIDEAKKKTKWKCKHGNEHDTMTCLKWIKQNRDCLPECEGLDEKSLQLSPTDRHLVKLATKIRVSKFNNFVICLGLEQDDWEDILDKYIGYDRLIPKFEALCKCRRTKERKRKKLTFSDLRHALDEIEYSKHHLCKLFHEDVDLHDIATGKLQEAPDDEVLEKLSRKIGNCAMHLGVELELELPMIDRIIHQHIKDIFGQNFGILQEWKTHGKNKTILFLMKALQQADERGLTFLMEKYD